MSKQQPRKHKVGDTVWPVYFQGKMHTATITDVARKWMTVTLPYETKVSMHGYGTEVRPGHWTNSPELAWHQKRKAMADNRSYYGKCRYCEYRYSGAGQYSHREVETHLHENHPEEFLDLLGGGDG